MYDPDGTFVMPSYNLVALLQQLKQPLGLSGFVPPLTRAQMLSHLGALQIPDHGGTIHFMETLTALSNNYAGVPLPMNDTTKKLAKRAAVVASIKKLPPTQHSALDGYRLSVLQSRFRAHNLQVAPHTPQPPVAVAVRAQQGQPDPGDAER